MGDLTVGVAPRDALNRQSQHLLLCSAAQKETRNLGEEVITARVIGRSLLWIVVAAVPGQFIYALAAKKNLLDPSFFLGMMVASFASFLIFSATKLIPSRTAQLLTGIGGSYLAFICLVFLVVFKGDVAEFTLWLPGVIVFGIPFMVPLVGLSWLGSTFVLGMKKRREPQETPITDR